MCYSPTIKPFLCSNRSPLHSIDPHTTPPVPAPVKTWKITSSDVEVTVCSVGASITKLKVKGVDVVLGFDKVRMGGSIAVSHN